MSSDQVIFFICSLVCILFAIGLIFGWTKETQKAEHLTDKQKRRNIIILKGLGIVMILVGIRFLFISFWAK